MPERLKEKNIMPEVRAFCKRQMANAKFVIANAKFAIVNAKFAISKCECECALRRNCKVRHIIVKKYSFHLKIIVSATFQGSKPIMLHINGKLGISACQL